MLYSISLGHGSISSSESAEKKFGDEMTVALWQAS